MLYFCSAPELRIEIMKPVFQIISEFESSFDPNSVTVDVNGQSFEIYPWLKPAIFSAIQRGNSVNSGNKSIKFQIKQLFSGYRYLKSPAKTIVFSNSLERRQLDGSVVDKLFEEITAHKKLQEAKTIEAKMPSNFFPLNDYANAKVASRASLYMQELVYGKLKIRELKINGLDPIRQFLEQNSLKIDVEGIVRRQLAQYHVMLRYLKKQRGLECVFLSVSYTNFGLILACKELKIKVVEVQHGVINSQHYGYTYTYDPKQNQFPDFLLTFGKADEAFIATGKLARFIHPTAVGSYVIQHYLNKTITKRPNSVAISGQDCETGVKAMESFIALAEACPETTFYFKRRRLDREFYTSRFTFPDNWQFEEEKDVYQLILSSDLHLTAYSSCALEAPSLGRCNVLFNLNNKAQEYYSEKLAAGSVNYFCDTVDDLKMALRDITDLKIDPTVIQASNDANIQANYSEHLNHFIETYLMS